MKRILGFGAVAAVISVMLLGMAGCDDHHRRHRRYDDRGDYRHHDRDGGIHVDIN